MSATRSLSLAARSPALPPAGDRGPMLNAEEIARTVWDGKVSAKWVIGKMRSIAFKPGKEWLWYQTEAEQWREEWLATRRRKNV